MTINVTNRKALRRALAAGLFNDLVHTVDGDNKPLDALYRYRKSKIDENFVICVTSASVNRIKQAEPSLVVSYVEFDIHIFVIYAANNFSEEDSEDKADDIEKAVNDWLLDHGTTSDWEGLEQSGPSEPDVQILSSGRTFRIETIPVRMKSDTD